jgi:N-acetylmuramic acid 6-phosphate etherase
MLEHLITEQKYAEWHMGDLLPTSGLLAAMSAADATVPAAVAREIPRIERAVNAIMAALDHGGSLIYTGAGTSGRLGVLDAAECPPTFHTPPGLVRALIAGGDAALRRSIEGAEDDPEAGVRDLIASGLSRSDAVIGISASGRTPYVIGALAHARRLGAITAGISCNPDSELSRIVEFPIEPLAGPEILAGSTRLRAGTATKLVLNMISTAVMIKLGYTYGGLMVNVQPTNQKLEDRAHRIIRQITGVSLDRAAELLDQAGRSVPAAIVMAKKGVSRSEAERLLSQARGRLALVLGEPALGEPAVGEPAMGEQALGE